MSNVVRFTRNTQERARKISPSHVQWFQKYRKPAIYLMSAFLVLWLGRAIYVYWAWEKTDNAYVESELTPMSSRIMGYVREVGVEQNQIVNKGDVLLTLDDADLRIELQVKQARFRKAESDLNRGNRLFKTQALAQSEFENIQAAFELAKADLDGTQLKLEFTQVRAPFAGSVAKLQAHRGQFVQPGQAVVTLVAHEETAWVKANFKETQIARIRPGMAVKLRFDAYPGEGFDGKVDSIFPSSGSVLSLIPPENATGNFTRIIQRIPVKVSVVPKVGYHLRPGMSAAVEVDVQSDAK